MLKNNFDYKLDKIELISRKRIILIILIFFVLINLYFSYLKKRRGAKHHPDFLNVFTLLCKKIFRGISQYNRLISLNISLTPIFSCKSLI